MNRFKPDHRYSSLSDIPIEEFARKGKRGALLDIDNTLVAYGEYEKIPPENLEWLKRAEASGVKCLLYSNASQWKIELIQKVANIPGVPKAYKPSSMQLGKALSILGCTKDEALMIGDQWCTDILGGSLVGMETILVEPLTENDWCGTKILRFIEWFAIPDRRPWRKKSR